MVLGFDASSGFHRYAFKWTSAGIEWYVDGYKVYEVVDTPGKPTPKATDSLQKIMMNLWPVDSTASQWAGTFVYPGTPLDAVYEWASFTKGEDCEIGKAPDPPTPPPSNGDENALSVADIGLSLASRDTQVIARVSVVDGTGKPAAGASVTGAWSGLITEGDTRRDTNNDGVATFYSRRTRDSGEVQFCVTDITRAGSTYDKASNKETCDAIVK
jgi:hypothetical protein